MRVVSCAALCLCFVSCVGTKKFTIRTQPEGAQIAINGVPQEGKTPMVLEIKQDKDLGIVATKPGYESAAHTVRTTSNWWLALLWTKHDPRARIIEEDEVTIPMQRIPSAEDYTPSSMPPYTGGGGRTTPKASVPELRPMPEGLMPQ